jgi:hypothetical protein
MERWIDTLTIISDALSGIDEYREAPECILEEEVNLKGGRKISKEFSKSVEKEEVKTIVNVGAINLAYFMDGFQRTILLGHIFSRRYGALLPIHLHISGVVIINTRGKAVFGPKTQIKLILPKREFLPKVVLDKLSDMIVETKDEGPPSYDYEELRKRGYNKSSRLRHYLEQNAINSFKSDGYLVVDGIIPQQKEIMERRDIIGIVKSHRMQYLKLEDEVKIFSMPPAHRSWLFEIKRKIGNNKLSVYSCYLRLREIGRDPLSGLVRIEVNPSLKENIDEICLSIFNERLPVQMNTKDWDRKIYQFYCCERIISAHLPARETLYAIFRRVI